ncbi:hypothetical protein AN958_01360 [Leucoagaricus sp. SymC.cos]|nr:hypothetical protein AN958_01360 [Leucoagaricus sp. SymC.cos]
MAEMYPKDCVNLRGLFYMHSASGARGASPLSNIEHYQQICGDPSMKRVRLVLLTRFGMGGDNAERERLVKPVRDSMRDFWNGFEALGSKVHTLEGSDSEGAWTIVDQLVADGSEAEHDVLNQAFAAIEKELNKTEPGKTLLGLMKTSLSQLRSKQDDPKELPTQYMRTRDLMTKMTPVIRDKLKVRVGERFTAFFTRMVSQLAIRCVRKCVYAYRLALLTLPVGAVPPSTYAFKFRIEQEADGSSLSQN